MTAIRNLTTRRLSGSREPAADGGSAGFAGAATALGQTHDKPRSWQLLRLLNQYRFTLSTLLLLLLLFGNEYVTYGRYNHQLALYICSLWLLFSGISSFFILHRKPAIEMQLYIHIPVDIAAVTMLMYTSGGVLSGLGMLLILPIALGGVIVANRIASLFAAIAALVFLGEELYAHAGNAFEVSYFQAGLSGSIFFATALLASLLAQRLQESEQHIKKQSGELADLTRLNEHIIQQMQSGIIVVDAAGRIHRMNQAAAMMLDSPAENSPPTLASLSPELAEQLRQWQQHSSPPEPRLINNKQLSTHLTSLGSNRDGCAIIYLEDSAALAQQAQQMKLASLGRLTASIAHEIRNPIGAIAHAGQLLAESPRLNSTDQRLNEITCTNTARVNTIIESILQLGRSKPTSSRTVHLKPWLETMVSECLKMGSQQDISIHSDVTPPDTTISFDPDQLHQVLWNLCQNSIHACPSQPEIKLYGSISPDSGIPFLEISDSGPGIKPELEQQIFEPFFTTDTTGTGTGLGLYIVRELCSANQAHIYYRPVTGGGACFRIDFCNR